MGYPEPELGLVISYSYLWSEERYLGLDSERSWIILDELNVFRWPGYDLRPIPDKDGRYDYGLLPPKLFESIVKKFAELRKSASSLALCVMMKYSAYGSRQITSV